MKKTLIIISIFIFYLLALNPYLGPAIYDDVVYYLGAESIAMGEGYHYQDKLVGDWPPLFSLLLSLPMQLGFTSIWASKLVVLAFVLLSFFAISKLMEIEKRGRQTIIFLLFALSPVALLFGSRVMSEWIFVCFAYLFLIGLHRIDKQQDLGLWTLLTGIFFGLAFLTRYAGILLLIPLFAGLLKKNGRDIHLKIAKTIVALIGLSLFFFVWYLPLKMARENQVLEIRYYQDPIKLFSIDFQSFFDANLQMITGIYPYSNLLIFLIPIFIPLMIGFYHRLKTQGLIGTDYWTLGTIFVCFIFSPKNSRYLLPVAPFIFSYIVLGLEQLFPKRVFIAVTSLWIGVFGFLDLFLLTQGNGKTYHGLSVLASPNPNDFYEGYWHDLYEIAEVINRSPSKGNIHFVGHDLEGEKYLYYFTKRNLLKEKQKTAISPFMLYKNEDAPMLSKEDVNFLHTYKNNSFLLLSENKALTSTLHESSSQHPSPEK